MTARESSAVPRRVWGATALQVGGRVFGSLTTLATLSILSRHLGAEGFGRYTFYLATFALLDALTDFGTGAIAVQRTAAAPERVAEVLAAARRIRVGTASVGIALLVALSIGFGEPGTAWIVAAGFYQLTHVLELSATVFKNRIAWGVPVAVRAIASTLRLGAVGALALADVQSAAVFLFATALASSSANGMLHLACRSHLPERTGSVARGILLAAWPLGVASLCQQAYFHIDSLFIRVIWNVEEVGRYNVGVRVLSFAILAAQVATLAALPWLVRCHERRQLARAASRIGQPLFAAAGLGAGLAWPWSEEILALLFGAEYRTAGESLRWLLVAALCVYAGAPLLTAVLATGRTRSVLAISAGGLALNLLGNAWLVPSHGIAGAAVTTAATELLVALLAVGALARAGVRLLAERPLLWLGGPTAFAFAAWASALFAH